MIWIIYHTDSDGYAAAWAVYFSMRCAFQSKYIGTMGLPKDRRAAKSLPLPGRSKTYGMDEPRRWLSSPRS